MVYELFAFTAYFPLNPLFIRAERYFFYQISLKNIFLDFFLPIFLPTAFSPSSEKHKIPCRPLSTRDSLYWANQIRTGECRSQSPVPYRLAIAHYSIVLFSAFMEKYLPETKSFLYSNKNPCYNFYNKDSKVDTGIRTQGLQSHNLAR